MIKEDMHVQVHMHKDGMRLKKFLIGILFVVLCTHSLSFFYVSPICRADGPPTLYVGPGETYIRIQDALNDAIDGYRIFVYNGTYHEHLIINHRIDLFGEDRGNTIINGDGADWVINVNVNNVNISHFTITNSSTEANKSIIQVNSDDSIITDNIISYGYHGICLNHSDSHLIYDNIIRYNYGDGIRLNRSDDNINISYNTIIGNKNGIYLYSSDGNKIFNNQIFNNNQCGIFLNSTCKYNIVRNNNVSENVQHGIYLNDYSDYQTITNNQLYYNENSGLVLENCSMNFNIDENTVIGNTNYGIMIVGSTNTVSNNIVSHNKKDGIYLSADDDNMIYKNTIGYNKLAGIRMYNSTSDYIRNNEIYDNEEYGAYLDFFTKNNVIYNNYFHDNTQNAIDKSINHNKWNITKTNGTNIVQGTTVFGNYWDDYDESSEAALDANLDGVADTPYTIYALNKDNGPLLDTVQPQIATPHASPAAQTLGKSTNLSILITDNTKIKEVFLNITKPSGQQDNFSITQNATGNTYYCNKIFSQIGNYTFHVAAKDPRNWNRSINQTFSIKPGNKPVVKDNSPSTGSPSKQFTFNVTVTSKEAQASDLQVVVIWSHGQTGNNSTMTRSTGNYFVATITLAHSIQDLTYHFYARDKWGSDTVTENKTIKIIDKELPRIHIRRYGSSSADLPNSYTYSASITDDSIVSTVTIEYWYNHSNKMKVNMDSLGNNNYKKVIVFDQNPSTLFCIINATDIAGHSNDTKKPFARHGGPYTGFVLQDMVFNGTKSFDLDGTITNYEWDFGDGTKTNGSTPTHIYYSSGKYVLKLTVTDIEGRNSTNQTYVTIYPFSRHSVPLSQLDVVNSRYNLDITEEFFCYDSDGNGIVDTFVDPSETLTVVHDQPVNLNGDIAFLISVDKDSIPEFFWDTTNDLIVPVTYTLGVVKNKVIDDVAETAKVYVTVSKGQWIYIEIDDQYPESSVIITTTGRSISADKLWRENQKIYVLDDPEVTYEFTFYDIYPALKAVFSPSDGGVISGDQPTIKITYNVPIVLISATFNQIDLGSYMTRLDDKSYLITPPGYLENGTYTLEVQAQSLQGKGYLTSSVVYFYLSYEPAPQKSFLEENGLLILLGMFIGAMGGLLFFFKVKNISIDGFIYLKNRKIIPFFKSVILGPVSVRLPQENLSKAEFYVDGQLKEEITSFPALWQWDEKAFLKHTLETKIYDTQGNSTSSGELEFYIFNLSKGKEH
jgi:parallel beta-helix repeat protein